MNNAVQPRANDRRAVRLVLLVLLAASVVTWGCLRCSPRVPPKSFAPVVPETHTVFSNGLGIKVVTNLTYQASALIPPEECALDLYIPQNAERAPILVYLHGGGWIGGNKNGIGPKSLTFASSGMIVASVNHRLAPMRPAPNACSDIAAAIAYIRQIASGLGGDPDRLVLLGHSAGAHLAALTICDERYLAPYPGAAAAIRGAVLLDGSAYDVPQMMHSYRAAIFADVFGSKEKLWTEVSPVHYAQQRKGLPPMLMVYAGEDELRKQAAYSLGQAISLGGAQASYLSAPDKTHFGLDEDLANPKDPISEAVMKFVRHCFGAE